MEKMRYGTKEIIATICSVLLMIASRWVELYLIYSGTVFSHVPDWIRLRIVVVALCAVLFGPAAGLIGGMSGEILINMVYGQTIGYSDFIAMGLYGLFLGLYFGRMHFDPQKFDFQSFLDFNMVQILAGVFITIFFIPMVNFLTGNGKLSDLVVNGTKNAAGNSLLVGIVCPLVMLIVSAFSKRRMDSST